ncbi:MAG: ATP-dependent helicase [Methanobacteriota archaeon]|nr:MAG: ATP-dependent helicase [Euryarchaeota archaeon]
MPMVYFAKKEYSESEILEVLHKDVRGWFVKKYKKFTPPQKFAVKEIHESKNVLISSPTGSGKTLSAFLSIISELLYMEEEDRLDEKIYCIYVSPLRALNNDIRRNLLQPIREIEKRSKRKLPLRIGIRTSDTLQKEKAAMLRNPPHILITTPESLSILLNSPKFSEHLSHVKWVIVDEIHSVVENKRGAHLALSLERLEARFGTFTRIGLSATVSPLEEVAQYLVGSERECIVVDVNYVKETDIRVVSPIEDIIYTPPDIANTKLYELLDKLIQEHRTTLIFTNTRSATERVVFQLRQRFGDRYIEDIAAHHSSLSREIRLDVEERLKRGELKVVVSSTSLELGIDIGNIDLVVLLGSPKSVARALQRVGRSGHRLHDISKGRIMVLDRDELVECTMLAKDALERKFDHIRMPKNSLDVLAQHIVGMAIERVWDVKEAYDTVRKAYNYKELPYTEFEDLLNYLAGNYEELEVRNVYGKIWMEDGKFGKRGKMIRSIYFMNTGTIPDVNYVKVFTRSKEYIGGVEEDFAEKLIRGDIFVLGGKSYEYVFSRGNRIYVDSVKDKRPTIPAWFSEMLPLSYELALDIEEFRGRVAAMQDDEAIDILVNEYYLDEKAARAILQYIREQQKYSIVPDKNIFLVEEYLDEEGMKNLIFHAMAGRKANEALARVFAYSIGEKKGINIRVTVTDYGFVLTIPRWRRINKEDIEEVLSISEEEFEARLEKSLKNSEIIRRRFRHVAARGFLILRRYGTRELSAGRQQFSADSLLKLLQKYRPDFPLLKEVKKEVYYEAMHVDEALDYLRRCSLKVFSYRQGLKVPSPFAFNMVASGAKDVVMLEERREFIRRMHKKLLEKIGEK